MTLPKEKINRIQEMIREHKCEEQFAEQKILSVQEHLDEHRKRRAILQDMLDEKMGAFTKTNDRPVEQNKSDNVVLIWIPILLLFLIFLVYFLLIPIDMSLNPCHYPNTTGISC